MRAGHGEIDTMHSQTCREAGRYGRFNLDVYSSTVAITRSIPLWRAVLLDVTEAKRMDDRLRESEQHMP